METWTDRLVHALHNRPDRSQSGLARACGISDSAVAQWTSGQTKHIRQDNLFAAADYLGVEARWLATGKGPMLRKVLDVSNLTDDQRRTLEQVADAFRNPKHRGMTGE